MHEPRPTVDPDRRGRLFRWINRRTGLDDVLREALDEPVPGGARFAYVFGSGLLFIFMSQVITGIWLALYYVPSSDHAHTTVSYNTRYLPRPEWYYIPIFQWLKYWPGSLSFIGVVVVPGIIAFLFASLPFFDRRMERRPWKRPIAVGCYVFVFLALFGLGYTSYRSDHNDPGYVAQLVAQEKETAEFIRQPFQPEASGISIAGIAPSAADPVVTKGKGIYEAQSCNACHGDAGVGTAAAPKLTAIGDRLSKGRLTALLKSPTPKMIAGGMSPLNLPEDQVNALASYLEALK